MVAMQQVQIAGNLVLGAMVTATTAVVLDTWRCEGVVVVGMDGVPLGGYSWGGCVDTRNLLAVRNVQRLVVMLVSVQANLKTRDTVQSFWGQANKVFSPPNPDFENTKTLQ